MEFDSFVLALLGQRRTTRGKDLPIGFRGIVRPLEELLRQWRVALVECKATKFGEEFAVLCVVHVRGLEDGQRLGLAIHRLQVARVVDRGLAVARLLGVLLAPMLGRLLEIRPRRRRARGDVRPRFRRRQRSTEHLIDRLRARAQRQCQPCDHHGPRGNTSDLA